MKIAVATLCAVVSAGLAAETPFEITFEPFSGTFTPPGTVLDDHFASSHFVDFNGTAVTDVDFEGFSDVFEADAGGTFLASSTLEISSVSGRAFRALSFDLGVTFLQTVTMNVFDVSGDLVFTDTFEDRLFGDGLEPTFEIDLGDVLPDTLVSRVTLSDGGRTFGVDNISGFSVDLASTAIPLPMPAAMALVGLVGVGSLRRR